MSSYIARKRLDKRNQLWSRLSLHRQQRRSPIRTAQNLCSIKQPIGALATLQSTLLLGQHRNLKDRIQKKTWQISVEGLATKAFKSQHCSPFIVKSKIILKNEKILSQRGVRRFKNMMIILKMIHQLSYQSFLRRPPWEQFWVWVHPKHLWRAKSNPRPRMTKTETMKNLKKRSKKR